MFDVSVAVVSLYQKHRKIYARSVTGVFAQWRWALVWATQILFYGLPWLNWNNRQAVLFDLVSRRFYIGGLVLYPQDLIYLSALLMISAYALFLFTAVAGRLWCGYACPQTVYTEIFMWFERKIEGDRAKRMKLDEGPWDANKLWRKSAKQAAWIAFGLWTGFTFVGYFTPIRTLGASVVSMGLGPWETFWIGFYGFATYGNAGWMREQVCKYMCPYARFQSAMFDKDTLIISYDKQRGEPRGSRSKKADIKQLGLGECVDCGLCVQVCPTGIDIRDGLQYQCINCGLCVDACDEVMTRVAKPLGLIRFASEQELAGMPRRGGRPRLAVYGGLIGVFVALGAWTATQRSLLLVDVLRDRGSLAREAADGRIENAYTLKLANLAEMPRDFEVEVSGLPGIELVGTRRFAGEAGSIRAVQVTVAAPADGGPSGARPITFQVRAADDPATRVTEKSTFVLP